MTPLPFRLVHEAVWARPEDFRETPQDNEQLGLPMYQELQLLRREGAHNCALVHLYCDAVPFQGRARCGPRQAGLRMDSPNWMHKGATPALMIAGYSECLISPRCEGRQRLRVHFPPGHENEGGDVQACSLRAAQKQPMQLRLLGTVHP